MTKPEGVVQYRCILQRQVLRTGPGLLAEINRWRRAMRERGWLGQDPRRYGGLGFGNISRRTADGFLVSATQTGHLKTLTADNLVLVTAALPEENRLYATGQVQPSSEAMTHAAIYRAVAVAGAVIHVHAPELWRAAAGRDWQRTDPSIPYGTPEMAAAIAALAERDHRLIVMGGHRDGVLAWGDSLAAAAAVLDEAARTVS